MPQQKEDIMKFSPILPENFTGTFYFTNPSDEDFVGMWGKKEYIFPANSTSPMLMPEYTALEIQHIRKKFAKDLAEREFFKSPGYERLRVVEGERDTRYGTLQPRLNSLHSANTYTIETLTPFIQLCLAPLPLKQATVRATSGRNTEAELSRNEDGEITTAAIKNDKDLEKLAKGDVK
jgi:hypothetical protein